MSIFSRIKSVISNFITGRSDIDIEELENLLIEADFGVELASSLASKLNKGNDIKEVLNIEFKKIFEELIKDINICDHKPYVITLCGVNGSGKTTTVAKLVNKFHNQNLFVDVAACDTFRAAADTQLEQWTNKLGCKLFKGINQDPASVAYTAISNTKSDVLIIDTAGRLPTNANLMEELGKIYRVIKKIDNTAPHLNLVVIDATTGQNAVEQVKSFNSVASVNGLILAKFDTGAKGGTVVRIASELRIPIYGVGTGERVEDFEKFSIEKFIAKLVEE